jgi:hypothetical protein
MFVVQSRSHFSYRRGFSRLSGVCCDGKGICHLLIERALKVINLSIRNHDIMTLMLDSENADANAKAGAGMQ